MFLNCIQNATLIQITIYRSITTIYLFLLLKYKTTPSIWFTLTRRTNHAFDLPQILDYKDKIMIKGIFLLLSMENNASWQLVHGFTVITSAWCPVFLNCIQHPTPIQITRYGSITTIYLFLLLKYKTTPSILFTLTRRTNHAFDLPQILDDKEKIMIKGIFLLLLMDNIASW